MQETQVRSLIQQDPLCCEATRFVYHNYRSCAREPRSRNYGAHVPQLLKPACTRTQALQQKKPHSEKPAHCNQRVAPTLCN